MSKKWTLVGLGFLLAAFVVVRVSGFSGGEKDLATLVDIQVTAVSIPLDPSQPSRRTVGKTEYVGGWALTSPSKSFGGFSGLMVTPENNSLLAINDRGEWWQASFDTRNMQQPPSNNKVLPYEGVANEGAKVDLDAESIIPYNNGVLISFEQRHRLEWVPSPGSVAKAPGFMLSASFAGISDNGGMEAITLTHDGKLLAFAERGLDQAGMLKAWLSTSDGRVETLSFKPPRNFAPTDAATLPNGDVLLLLRQYSAIDGVAIKVHHIRRADIQAGGLLAGDEILHLTPKMSVDNMEGLDVVVLDDNTVRLVMVSDDNFNALQRTLLMMFDYKFQDFD